MDGVMSQEEINALLNGSEDSSEQPKEEVLTEKEKDTIGEDMCFNNHCQLFDKDRCTACYLKNARIAVEEEMDQ